MKVFTMNSRRVNGETKLQNVSCNLSVDELQQILLGVESLQKSDNEVIQSVRFSIVESIKSVLS